MKKSDIKWINGTIATLKNTENYEFSHEDLISIEQYILLLEQNSTLTKVEKNKIIKAKALLSSLNYKNNQKEIFPSEENNSQDSDYTEDRGIAMFVLWTLLTVLVVALVIVIGFLSYSKYQSYQEQKTEEKQQLQNQMEQQAKRTEGLEAKVKQAQDAAAAAEAAAAKSKSSQQQVPQQQQTPQQQGRQVCENHFNPGIGKNEVQCYYKYN